MALEPKSKTNVRTFKTDTGLKDTYLDTFLERLFRASKKKTGGAAEAAINAELLKMQKNVYSPVWRIRGKLQISGIFNPEANGNPSRPGPPSQHSSRDFTRHPIGVREIPLASCDRENQARGEGLTGDTTLCI